MAAFRVYVEPYHDQNIWAYLDADEKPNAAAMWKSGASGIPHIEILSMDGKSIGKAVGGTRGLTPEEVKQRYTTAFDIDFNWFIKAAARRQKWIDQSQSVNLFLKQTDMKTLSHMYRAAWRAGLKTTYYLRTMGASNIEKATVSVKKEVRGHAGNNGATREFTEEERTTCSIEAMMNGGTCEACQ